MKVTEFKTETVGTEVKTDNRHVSFKECFSDGWREYFRKEDVLLKILEAAGLTRTHDFVQVNSRYLIDDHRVAIILLLRRKGTEILDKVIVDAISGWPSFEQMMDVFYTIGADCDYRVALYDENAKFELWKDDEFADNCILPSLMDNLSGQVALTVMSIDLEVNEEKVVNLQCHNIESISKEDAGPKLPDRVILEKAQFWGPYFLPEHCCGLSCDEYDFYGGGYEEDTSDYMSSFADWDDDGMSVEYEIDNDDLTWLFANKLKEMESLFKDCSINHSLEECKTTVIKRDIPLCGAVNTMPEEKNFSSEKHKLTIFRPIPFRNFMHSLHRDRNKLTEQFVFYARSAKYLDELLAEREDKNENDIFPKSVANTKPQ